LLDCSFLSVLLVDLIEETCEFVFHDSDKMVLVLVVRRVVYFGIAVINFLVPVHFQFFLVDNVLVSKRHKELYCHASSVSVLYLIITTLIIPVFNLFLSTDEAGPMRWPSGYAKREGLGEVRNFESSHILNLCHGLFTFLDRYFRIY